MKLSDMFHQNSNYFMDKIQENSGKTDLNKQSLSKVKVMAKIKRQCPWEQKTCQPKKI